MRLIDWYFLRQALAPFVFFTVVLTAVIWLAQSLQIIDLIVDNGQSAMILIEFAVPLLPKVFAVVFPIAVLGATVYALHRLLSESELVVVYGAGQGRLSATRAVVVFGLVMTVVLGFLNLYLMPLGSQILRERTAEVRADVAAALIQDGRFLHPGRGLTVYVRDAPSAEVMHGLFVHDARDKEDQVTFNAQRGALAQTDEGARLVMFDGVAQRVDPKTGELSLLRFETFTYDLSAFSSDPNTRTRKPSEFFFPDLVWPSEDLDENTRRRFISEGHDQLSAPLYGFALAVVAAAVMLGGSFSRRGYFLRVLGAIAAGVLLRVSGIALHNAIKSDEALWPLVYVPPLLGTIVALVLLSRGRFKMAPPAPKKMRRSGANA